MSLANFQKCDLTHEKQFEYCCIRSKRIFCQNCWFKENHAYKCFSSKCGHYEKIAYATIQKNLEIKTMHFNSQMCSSYNKFQMCYKNFFRFKEVITQKIKTDIQSKLPLYIWAAFLEMMSFKNPKLANLVYEESMCSDLLRLLKRKEDNKIKILEEVVRSYDKMMHSYTGLQNKLKSKNYEGTLDKDAEEVVNFFINEGGYFICELNSSIKTYFEDEISKLLKKYDPSIQFDSIKFNNKQTFQGIQRYNSDSLYSSIVCGSQINALFHGVQLNINKLEQSPQMLLEISKSILKQKIYQLHSGANAVKSNYPYKYGYLIATCLEPDPEYEISVIGLQKNYIKTFERKSQNSFLSSINLLIMGPELITIEHKNYPKKMTEINIFGYEQNRQRHYIDLIQNHIGLGKQKTDKSESRKFNKIKFESQISLVQLVYVQFQLAYQHLFTHRENRSYFEGERYLIGRGLKLFEGLCQSWNEKAVIDLPIEKNQKDYMPYIY